MTQAYTEGTGAKEFDANGQTPGSRTFVTIPSKSNRLADGYVSLFKDVDTSADFDWRFVAPENGRIAALRYANGATAADGSNGWELSFVNKTNSDDVLAYFGIGSGTEAAKATDTDTAVAANGSAEISNSDTSRFNKGDVIQLTADRDGTSIVGAFEIILELGSVGR